MKEKGQVIIRRSHCMDSLKEMLKKMKHGKLALAKKRRFKERNKGPHNSCSEPGQALRNNSVRKRSDGKDISLLFRLCGEREKINH